MTQISEELMEKFITNTCTDEELVLIDNWLKESDGNADELFGTELAAMLAFDMRQDDETTVRIARKIKQRIAARQQIRQRSRRLRFVISSAAAAMIAVAVTIAWIMFRPSDMKMLRAVATTTTRSIILPDSTTVYLNQHSQLRYPTVFKGRERLVELEGEGYFDVTPDKKHPFIVKGQYLVVRVMGTQFYFNSQDSVDNSVSLIEGSVEVSAHNQPESIVLIPGQKVNYDIESGEMTVDSPKTPLDIAWHSRIIPFENANITEIRDILYQLYGIPIQLYGDIDYSATYSGGTIYYKDIDSTLTQLANTIPITFINHGDKIEIHVLKK